MLGLPKFKACADERKNLHKMRISVCDRVENMEGNAENADYQLVLLFPQCYPKPFLSGPLKLRIVLQTVKWWLKLRVTC